MNAPVSPYLFPELTFVAAGEYDTARLAAALAKMSVAGDLIRLVGDLGAGKSTFSRHYIQALGHVGDVPSPTYTLVQTYTDTRFNLAHVDCYRMKQPEELDGLGLEAYRKFGILLVEWPEKGGAMVAEGQPDFLPYYINSMENTGTLTLTFEAGASEFSRVIRLTASPSWQRRFGLIGKMGVGFEGATLNRPVSDAGRAAFLESLGLSGFRIESEPADWSSRSYARVYLNGDAAGATRILMDSPPPLEGVAEYVQVADYYRGIGLRAAEIVGRNDSEGYLLTEDFGNTQLWEFVKDGERHTEWYKAVADGLVEQCLSHELSGAPEWARKYSPKEWWVEAVRFVNWYMPYAKGRACTLEEYAQWQAMWLPLFGKIMQLPQGLMMWDCQTPNLMVLGHEPKLENLGWIDIQDARVASVAQDLALLLRNIRSPQDDVREAEVLAYIAPKLGCDLEALKTAVDICSLQHSCRILGGLTRLHVRDGRSAPAVNYLARLWDVARQSADCADVKAIWDFMQPWEVPGLTRLWKETQGKAA